MTMTPVNLTENSLLNTWCPLAPKNRGKPAIPLRSCFGESQKIRPKAISPKWKIYGLSWVNVSKSPQLILVALLPSRTLLFPFALPASTPGKIWVQAQGTIRMLSYYLTTYPTPVISGHRIEQCFSETRIEHCFSESPVLRL